MEYIANRLLEIETMDGKEFYDILKGEEHCKKIVSDSDSPNLSASEEKVSENPDENSTSSNDDCVSADFDENEKPKKKKAGRPRKIKDETAE